MKKITLLLLLLSTTLSFAQVSIGNGDDGSGFNSPPISPYYGTSYSQSIYLASEINASGNVTSIEYALNAGSDLSGSDDNVDVWIGHTAKTAFDSASDWVDVSTLSHVLVDGTVTVANDVLIITFSSSFAYNGTDNLVVAIDANESGYDGSADYVLSTNGPTEDMTLDQKSDTTNSDPTAPELGELRQNRGNITFNGITQSCPVTSALALDDLTASTATISWTAGGTETAWEYVVQAAGTGEPTASGTTTTTNPLSLSGLTASTAYEIYVRANCGGDTSSWVSTTFTTECAVFTAPYSQDFENTGSIPDCWSMSGGEPWVFSTSGGHVGNAGLIGNSSASGGYFAYVDDSTPDNTGTTLQTPSVDVSGLTTPILNFYLLSNNEGNSNVNFSVDVYDGSSWNTGVYTSNTNTADWVEVTIDLSSLTITGAIKARFIVDEVTSGDFYDDVAIDDVRIMEMPSCLTPTALALDDLTTTTATISWTAGGTETAWEYVVQAYGTGEPTASGTSTTSNPLTVSGLTANTAYDFYVRADCGGGDTSDWKYGGSFTTNCDTADEALSHNFDTLDNNNLVVDASCWSVSNGGDANTWGLISDSTTGNVYWNLLYDSSTAHDDYLYSPKFSVIDGVTDAFNFKGWNPNTTWPEVIDVLVVDASDNSLIATLVTDLNLPEPDATTGEATVFTYDLSAYEGQDVRIAFYSSTTDQNAARIDDFTLDAFSTLGTATNILEGFTLYPTIVKEELNFRSQNKVEAITVFNLLGQKVFSGAPNANNSSVNLSTLRPGVYIVKVSAEGNIGSYKIIKE